MLHALPQPVYVLDDERTIVFFNEACGEWLGGAAEGLIGRRCAYHSSDQPPEDRVSAGLCPPPGALAGREMSGTVFCPDSGSEEGRDVSIRYRHAHFIPLNAGPDDVLGLVAILDRQDLDTRVEAHDWCPPAASEVSPTVLHEQIRRFRQRAATRSRAERLIGNSSAMRRVRAQIDLAAASRASVLLVGPAGSGKQRVSEAIHYAAPAHRRGSLIPLACTVLGADLIRSTITALASAQKLDDEAQPGTLLLNDADQIPLEVQCSLVPVLGGRTFPLRVIATATRPLARLVRRGKYREELASILSTLTIELPPLVKRRGDLPLLAQLCLEEVNTRSSKQVGGFTPAALDAMDGYPWPGNVDELAQLVAEAHRKAAGPEITPEDLPPRIHLAADAAAFPRPVEETIVLDEYLARVERELIERALLQSKGNKAKAGRLLSISRARLLRRVEQLGLDPWQGASSTDDSVLGPARPLVDSPVDHLQPPEEPT